MSCLLMVILVFSPVTIAHFTLLHPPTVHTVPGVIPSIPKCGYDPYPIPSDITAVPPIFSPEHGQIAVTTHGDAAWRIRIVFDPIRPGGRGTSKFIDLYPKLKTYGNGTFCINTFDAPKFTAWNLGAYNVEALDALQAWISVRGTMEDGRFYQCALVTFSSNAPDHFSTDACKNSTGVEVSYDRNQIASGGSGSGETDNPYFYSNPNEQGGNTTIWEHSTTTIWGSTSETESELWSLAESTDSSNSAATTSSQVLSESAEASTTVVTRTEVVTSTATQAGTSDGNRVRTISSWRVFGVMIGTTLITMLRSL